MDLLGQPSFIVGITGASRSGKSLLSKNLSCALATCRCQVVGQDDFRRLGKRAAADSWVQKDAGWLRDWETPNQTDWPAFIEAIRHAASVSDFVLVEGYCLLHSDAVCELLQGLIWIEIDESTLRQRRKSFPKGLDATAYFDDCIWPAHLRYRAAVFGDNDILGRSGKSSCFADHICMFSGVDPPADICAQAQSVILCWSESAHFLKRQLAQQCIATVGAPQIKPESQLSCWVEVPAAEHKATLVFIHGLPFCGKRGSDQLKLFSVCWTKSLWQHVRFVAPSCQDGRQWCAYNSEPGADGQWQWDEEAAEAATAALAQLVEDEAARLKEGSHLVVAGCSQGASLAVRAVARASNVAAHVVCLRGAPQPRPLPAQGRCGAMDVRPDSPDPRCCFYWLVGAQDQFWPRSVFCKAIEDFLSVGAHSGSPAKCAAVLVEDIDHFAFSKAEDVLLAELMHVVVQPPSSLLSDYNSHAEKNVIRQPALAVLQAVVERVLQKVHLEASYSGPGLEEK